MASKACAEFLGTAVLMATFTNVTINDSGLGALAVASSLMIAAYSLGSVSGGHFNPAVTIAAQLRNIVGGKSCECKEACVYIIMQLLGAACSAAVCTVIWTTHKDAVYPSGVIPSANVTHPWKNDVLRDYVANNGSVSVLGSEFIYTFMLVFVIMNVATCEDTKDEKNFYAPLAIGFVITAAASAVGGMSGCCLNPAVSFGATLMNLIYGKMTVAAAHAMGYWLAYSFIEILGAVVAIAVFAIVRKATITAQKKGDADVAEASLVSKLLSEMLGTFFLCLTVQLVVNGPGSPIGAVGIASSLMVMIYALGAVSGANFNPAVSIGLLASGELSPKDFICYVLSQNLGAVLAFWMAVWLLSGDIKVALIGADYTAPVNKTVGGVVTLVNQTTNASAGTGDWFAILTAEFIFTTMLVFTVLNVAVGDAPNQHYGLAIGFVVVVGAAAVGSVSGGAFNPSVSLSLDLNGLYAKGGSYGWGFLYQLVQLISGLFAAALYKCVRCKDDDDDEFDEVGVE